MTARQTFQSWYGEAFLNFKAKLTAHSSDHIKPETIFFFSKEGTHISLNKLSAYQLLSIPASHTRSALCESAFLSTHTHLLHMGGQGGKRNVPLLVNKIVSKYLFRRRATLISLFVKESNHFIMLHKSSSSSSVSAFVQKPDLLLEHWEHFAGHVSCSKRLAANMFRSSCGEELITKGNQWWTVHCQNPCIQVE